jgi:hypothetical protein
MKWTALPLPPDSQTGQPSEWPFAAFMAGIFLIIVVKALLEQGF